MRRRVDAPRLALVIAAAALAAALDAAAAVREHRHAVVAPGPGQRRRRAGRSSPGRRRGAPVTLNGADVTRRLPAGARPHPRRPRRGAEARRRTSSPPAACSWSCATIRSPGRSPPARTRRRSSAPPATFKLYAALGGTGGSASDETLGPSQGAGLLGQDQDHLPLPAERRGRAGAAAGPAPALPADVATTTTTTGQSVPFVVRVETAVIDRGIYQSTVLFDPTSRPAAHLADPAARLEPAADRRPGRRLPGRLVLPGPGRRQRRPGRSAAWTPASTA